MKQFCIVLISFLCFFSSFGQKQSNIYNKRGRLIADTSFSITKKQLKRFITIEDTLLKQLLDRTLLPKLTYPEVERDAGIDDTLLIVSFLIKNDSLRLKKIVRGGKGDPGIIREVKEKLLAIKFPSFNKENHMSRDTLPYYLAFSWRLFSIKVNKDAAGVILNKGKITIFQNELILIVPYTEDGKTITNDSGLYFDTTKCEHTSLLWHHDTNRIKIIRVIHPDTLLCSISGYLVDRTSNTPLSNAEVDVHAKVWFYDKVFDSTCTILTDNRGYFDFTKGTKLIATLRFYAQGYQCLRVNDINLNGSDFEEVKIKLKEN